ncbi:hypothetical protein D5018_18450 [Parashewanella curva]|uniref:Uncharacterized protein n=1 Tax=Parashewanella curva TaxID=2338552 RepID=A0A3L8PS42_9GAMM|nr:hypothetical protein [Parashewanella curva]RLV58230.1 hypothetical protein D5018_18450 [Parashewanella curva]
MTTIQTSNDIHQTLLDGASALILSDSNQLSLHLSTPSGLKVYLIALEAPLYKQSSGGKISPVTTSYFGQVFDYKDSRLDSAVLEWKKNFCVRQYILKAPKSSELCHSKRIILDGFWFHLLQARHPTPNFSGYAKVRFQDTTFYLNPSVASEEKCDNCDADKFNQSQFILQKKDNKAFTEWEKGIKTRETEIYRYETAFCNHVGRTKQELLAAISAFKLIAVSDKNRETRLSSCLLTKVPLEFTPTNLGVIVEEKPTEFDRQKSHGISNNKMFQLLLCELSIYPSIVTAVILSRHAMYYKVEDMPLSLFKRYVSRGESCGSIVIFKCFLRDLEALHDKNIALGNISSRSLIVCTTDNGEFQPPLTTVKLADISHSLIFLAAPLDDTSLCEPEPDAVKSKHSTENNILICHPTRSFKPKHLVPNALMTKPNQEQLRKHLDIDDYLALQTILQCVSPKIAGIIKANRYFTWSEGYKKEHELVYYEEIQKLIIPEFRDSVMTFLNEPHLHPLPCSLYRCINWPS